MARTIKKPGNRKSIQCELCGKWLGMQGYYGHMRWYHGEYERKRKSKLFHRLAGLSEAGKITAEMFSAGVAIVGAGSHSTTREIDMLEDSMERWGKA